MVNLAYTVENSSSSSKDLFSKRDFVLHAENLDLIYYRAAAIALIKAKTASVLREFPSKAEAILFAQCQDSAPTPTTLAKCAVSVFKARDNYRSHLASHREHSNVDEDFGDSMRDGESWISTIVRKMLAKPAETVKNHFVKWLDTIRTEAKLQKEKGNTLSNMSNISMSKSAEKESDIKVTEPVLHEPSRQTSAEVQKASKEGPSADENNTSEELLITSISEEPLNESKDQKNSTNLESLPKNIRKNFLLFHKYTHPRRKSANKTEFRLQKLLKRIKKMIIRQRRRRSVENPNDEGKHVNLPQTNTFNLKKLQKFYARVAEITNHMKIMGENNFDFLNTFGQMTRIFPSSFKFHHQMDNAESNPLLRKAENRLNQYLPEPVEILSPKVFTLFPEKEVFSQSAENKNETSENDKTKRILSPTVLSFQKQGLLSMPSLLSFLPVEEQFNWLELLLECSGAGRLLERLLKLLGPRKFKEVEETIFPIIQKLKSLESRFGRLKQEQTPEQKKRLEVTGYTTLTSEQAKILLGNNTVTKDFENLTSDDLEAIIEEDIRQLAQLDEISIMNETNTNDNSFVRNKRFVSTQTFGNTRIMNPYLFANQVREGAVMRQVYISPRAFGSALFSPDFLGFHILSPAAFFPAALSPSAMIASLLSPSAFSVGVLNPAALTFDFMNPAAFAFSALSPRALSANIMNPRALVGGVLSPSTLAVNIASPTALAFSVLSPNILTVTTHSPLYNSIIVMSPNILSGIFFSPGANNLIILSPIVFGTIVN